MGSKLTYKINSIPTIHPNAEQNGLACIACGKSPSNKYPFHLEYEVQLFNGRLVDTTNWEFWAEHEEEIGIWYVCDTCSLKFASEVLIEC